MTARYRIERRSSYDRAAKRWARHLDYKDLDKALDKWRGLNSIAPHRLIDRVTGEVVEPKE